MITHDVLFSLMHVLQNGRFRDDPSSLTHERTKVRFTIYLNKPSIALFSELGQGNVDF